MKKQALSAVTRHRLALDAARFARQVSSSVAVLLACSALVVARTPMANAAGRLPTPCDGGVCGTSGKNLAFASTGKGYVDPARSNESTLTVKQESSRATFNWKNFNLDRGNSVQFDQPNKESVALNRIWQADPSAIAGNLRANGQIYLINQNGILFKDGASVNTQALIASTLDLSDDAFQKGIIQPGNPAIFAGTSGSIEVEKGAELSANPGGWIMLLAPTVNNAGKIETNDGQVILAAGQKVYLRPADANDASLRGMLVEVDAGGTASNLGEIIANRGNATLMGLAVNQQGIVRASTSVSANGSIYLLARDSTTNRASAGGNQVVATRTGKVTLAAGSLTEILPENDGQASVDAQVQIPSRLAVMGKTIELGAGASVHLPGGEVTLRAIDNPLVAAAAGAPATANRIYLDAGARIDVAGSADVEVPMERNFVTVRLTNNEFADSPLQRDGALMFRTVTIDARQGSTLADFSAHIAANTKRTAAERTAGGGSITLLSDGDIVARDGSLFDVSGGWVRYAAGYGHTSRLLGADGRTYDITTAPKDMRYGADATTTGYSRYSDKWKVTQSWQPISAAGRGRAPASVSSEPSVWYPGYVEGRDAGTLTVMGRRIVLDGALQGQTRTGEYQRDPGKLPQGGRLVIGDAAMKNEPVADFRAPPIIFSLAPEVQLLPADFDASTPLPDWRADTLTLSTGFLGQGGGFSRLEAYSNGGILLPSGVNLVLPVGGSLSLVGGSVDVGGNIVVPGGTIELMSKSILNASAGSNAVSIAPGSLVSASGRWTNDLLVGGPAGDVALDGGSIKLSSLSDLQLGADSRLDVSAGAWLKADRTQRLGKGGSISLATNVGVPAAQSATGRLSLGGELRGDGFTRGGSLTLSAAQARVGGAAQAVNELQLSPGFFDQGGFANFKLSGRDGLAIEPGVRIAPVASNLVLSPDAARHATAPDLGSVAVVQQLAADKRAPVNLTFAADSPYNGRLTLGAGAALVTEAGGSIALSAGRQLTVLGRIEAPAGKISLTMKGAPGSPDDAPIGYLADQSIWLGADSALLATGAVRLSSTAAAGLRQGELLDGGEIAISADKGFVIAEAGAKLDVAGASALLNVIRTENRRRTNAPLAVDGAAGSIRVFAREGIMLDASLSGRAAGKASGGTLAVSLDRPDDNDSEPNLASYPKGERELIVRATGAAVPADLRPGDAIDPAQNGKAFVAADAVLNGGFDDLQLKSRDAISFAGDVALDLRRALTLDAPNIVGTNGARVDLAAAYVSVGNSNPGYQAKAKPATAGDAEIVLHGRQNLDAVGATSLQGFAKARLDSDHDLRLRGVWLADPATTHPSGRLDAPGDLALNARQIYPTTLSQFTLKAATEIDVSGGGASDLPLSAGGSITLEAPVINQGGVLRAPLGEIAFNAGSRLNLAAGSLTSVSADGLLVPFGHTVDGTWKYDAGGGKILDVAAPPEKRVHFDGANATVEAGAVVDAAGGGDLLAYEWFQGRGGSRDVLADASGYAILPWLKDGVGAFDPEFAKDSAVRPGDAVYLAGMPGLPAGIYTLLPARYAVLPGAYLVKPVAGYRDLELGIRLPQRDGSAIVAGQRVVAGTDRSEARSNGFLVVPNTVVRSQSEYQLSYGDAFFERAALAADQAVPRLARDGGRLVVSATGTVDVAGALRFDGAEGGRGGQADLDLPGTVMLASTNSLLAGLQIDSLLVGGQREQTVDGMRIVVRADAIDVQNDAAHPLSASEVILVAKDSVTVADGSVIQATSGSASPAGTITLADGDDRGALLRVAAGAQATVARSSVTDRERGTLKVGANAVLQGDALLLDATSDTSIDPRAALSARAVSLAAKRLNLGTPEAGAEGLTLSDALLKRFGTLDQLALRSYSTLDIYGNAQLGNAGLDLSIEAAGLGGNANVGATAEIRAATLTLGNRNGVAFGATSTAGAGSTLKLSANRLVLGAGKDASGTTGFDVRGYEKVDVAAGEIVGAGTGRTFVDGQLDVATARYSGKAGSNQTIEVTGDVRLHAAPAQLAASAELGAVLQVVGKSIRQETLIDLPSGKLTLRATGTAAGDGVVLGAGSTSRVAGSEQVFFDTSVFAAGGSVTLEAANGSVTVERGALVDIAGAAAGGDAGTLTVNAANGRLVVDGELRGGAASGYRNGSFVADFADLNNFSALNSQLNRGHLSGQRTLRARSGDVTIAGTDNVFARGISLTVDGGKLDVFGLVDTAAEAGAGGRVELYARDDLTVHQDAIVAAAGLGEAMNGGKIVLGSGQGSIDVQWGSLIDVSGATGAAGGEVSLRALRTANDVKVTGLAGEFRGASAINLEAFRVYEKTSVTSADQTTFKNDATNYLAAASAVPTRLGMAGNAAFHFQPGVEVRSSNGNLTVGTDWNLGAVRFGAAAEPGRLTLRAKGDVLLNASIGDGFSGLAGTETAPNPGSAWSFRVAAGADLASANPLAVLRDNQLAAGKGNVNLAAAKLLRTGQGSIEVAAGRNITLKASTTGKGMIYTAAGGDLGLTAGGDITGELASDGKSQLISEWLWRDKSRWYVRFNEFKQGVGALGGGEVRIAAGGDVTNLVAAVPTAGSLDADKNLVVTGGGSLSVDAGRDIRSGVFYVGRGEGRLAAGRNLAPADNRKVGTMLALGDGHFDVRARGDLQIATVFNPTVTPQNKRNASSELNKDSVYFFTYGPQSGVSLQSLAGDVTLDPDLTKLTANNLTADLRVSNTSHTGAYQLLPGSLHAAALNGDVSVRSKVWLYPSVDGDLELLARNSVNVAAALSMSDVSPAALPSLATPRTKYVDLGTDVARDASSGLRAHGLTPARSEAAVDPVRVYARTGSVVGGDEGGRWLLPKSFRIAAGEDVRNVFVTAQNLRPTDVSSIEAGRDVDYRKAGTATAIEVGGPGAVYVMAGRNVALGASKGILTKGNLNNPNLPSEGADLNVFAGLGKGQDGAVRPPDYAAFIAAYLDPAGSDAAQGRFTPELIAYLREVRGDAWFDEFVASYGGGSVARSGLGPSEPVAAAAVTAEVQPVAPGDPALPHDAAFAAFRTLPAELQRPLVHRVFYRELSRSTVSASLPGYRAVATLFPVTAPGGTPPMMPANDAQADAYLAQAGNAYHGDLTLYSSQIKTEKDGAINLMVPGGMVNAGLANSNAGKTPGELGVVTLGGGDIQAMVHGDFQVNQSRIFAVPGDILLWSSTGKIDAGKGSKSVLAVPPPQFSIDQNGNTQVNASSTVAGSGIAVLLTSHDTTPREIVLLAPKGSVDAGEAGIENKGGKVRLEALVIENAINIGGASVVGVPVAPDTAGLGGALASLSSVGDAVNPAAEATKSLAAATQSALKESFRPSFITVEVVGYGDA